MPGNLIRADPLRRAWGRSRANKVLIVLACVIAAFELAYLVVANGLLWTGMLVKGANRATRDIHIEINGPCWTVLPGRVHGRKVVFRFQDRNEQFYLTLESVVLDISLWHLAGKRFHATRARGEGAHYLFRHKVEQAEGIERRLAHYPKIPGFSDPPLITKPRTPALSDAEYNLWTISFDDVDVGIDELWFLEARLRGDMRATGGFYLQPDRVARTERCRLVIATSMLDIGPRTLATNFKGELAVQLHQHDPRVVEGAQIFTKISLKTNLNGTVPNLDATQLYTEPDGLHVEADPGTLQLRAELKHGKWTRGSLAEYRSDRVKATLDGASVSGPIELRAEIVRGGGKDSQVRFGLDSKRLQLAMRGVPDKLEDPVAQHVKLAMGALADLTQTPRWVAAFADLHARVPALRWLNGVSRRELFTGGSAKADLHAEWAEGRDGRGKLRIGAEHAAVSVGDQPVVFSGTVHADAVYDGKSQRGHFQTLKLDLPELIASNVPVPGGVQVEGDVRFWQLTPPKKLEGRLELQSQTLDPLMPLVIPSDILRSLAKVLVNLGKTRAQINFEHSDTSLDLQLTQLRSGDVQAFGMLNKYKSKDPCGQFYIDGAVDVGLVMMDGETSIKPLVSQDWWRERPDMATWCASTADASPAGKSHAR